MNMNDLISDENYLMRDWENLCNNPWTVKGIDVGDDDDHYGISIDHKTIKEIVEEAVKEALKEEVANEPITIRIEKYHMKHK